MEKFEVQIGPGPRELVIEAEENHSEQPKRFRILSKNRTDEWLERGAIGDVPKDNLLGVISLSSEKDFLFEGDESFSGDDLLTIAAQITRHPSFKDK
jgi:hypothetical protein